MPDHARILIVDDEPNVLFVLERVLRKEKYLVDTAADGHQALAKIERQAYDLVLLDLQMQPVSGIQVLETVRARDPEAVVIILTAHSTVESAVEALRLGAFDYLFKPAQPQALRQRVRDGLQQRREAQRRAHVINQVESLRATLMDLNQDSGPRALDSLHGSGPLAIDLRHRVVTLRGRLLDLTTAEFNVLRCLIEQAPAPVSPRQLVNQALEYDAGDGEAAEIVKYHIHQLRKKIEQDPVHPKLIKTVRYKGYLWSGE